MEDITPSELAEFTTYDPETGEFEWRPRRSWFATEHHWQAFLAMQAGHKPFTTPHNGGYLYGRVRGAAILAHRAAWALMRGIWPEQIDHINHKGTDNRFANLRETGQQENCRNQSRRSNNTSGVTGVSWSVERRKWCASIMVDGKCVPLGRHATFEGAVSARKAGEAKYGFHENHGRNASEIET